MTQEEIFRAMLPDGVTVLGVEELCRNHTKLNGGTEIDGSFVMTLQIGGSYSGLFAGNQTKMRHDFRRTTGRALILPEDREEAFHQWRKLFMLIAISGWADHIKDASATADRIRRELKM